MHWNIYAVIPLILTFSSLVQPTNGAIDRQSIVSRYNPTRNVSSQTTPMQVGNGFFAFGADVTGLQTFEPFAIMSSWGWKNDTLPPGKTLEDIANYHGVSWLNHGRLVEYDFGSNDPALEQWLTANPNRVNLGRIGLLFRDGGGNVLNVTEADLEDVKQELDLWTGKMSSSFVFGGEQVRINVVSGQDTDTVAVSIQSTLLVNNTLGIFLDFPWNDGLSKFSAPFVGSFNLTSNHTTNLSTNLGGGIQAQIAHQLVASTFLTSLGGDNFTITRDSPSTHRYTVLSNSPTSDTFSFTSTFTTADRMPSTIPSPAEVEESSVSAWEEYWSTSGFVDVFTGSTDPRADELQRRIILSRYLMRVNEAGDSPPQESGLVNDGWSQSRHNCPVRFLLFLRSKFHMEMYFWHSCHWALWNNWDLLSRSSSIYSRFLPSSLARAQIQQGWSSGARWPKMTDPSGRSSPGEINNLLIWQQPHPLMFATYELRSVSTDQEKKQAVLEKWEDVVRETANWMSAFAWWNESTSVYDLGPPMYVVSEDTSPNVTQNPAFELAYWKLGLGIAEMWMNELGVDIPSNWTDVKNNLAQLPLEQTDNGTFYKVYEGLEDDFWTDPEFTNDHPALVGLYGWLPQTEDVDLSIAKATAEKVWVNWNISNCWGWDFPMLAMSAARNGETEQAIDWLLHPLFQFDDVGMPIGGVRVPTPYFPGSGSLLYSIAMMAGGWDGSDGNAPGFPKDGWNVTVESISKAL
ncbi:hypothetical protein K435DRAFT_967064 [Dendrothele bispora CBS 962.96]|uniref:Six-hairpin glycosidase n=1 Tax=Dendrothele bispora (strain CBS 962.96) TaxID=1314807 RepID=A0A4S8LWA5_DENBC|nr:hypothetical protein K435DRAFT_967064 [Dendrothele bispora CBS 962.96]